MQNQVISYHKTRDFGTKVSVTFEFIRQNFKGLSASILLIAGPPVLLASLLLGSFFQDLFSVGMAAGRGGDAFLAMVTSPTFWMQMLLMMVFMLVSSVAALATINCYLILYEEKQSTQITVAEVWERVRSTFFMYVGTALLFTLLAIATYIVMIIPVALFGVISPVLASLFLIAFFVAICYIFIATSLTFIIRSYEKSGFFEALVRSFKLVQGKWWSTFGIILVLYLIAGVISYVFMIPWYIVFVVSALHDAGVEGYQNTTSVMGVISTILLTIYHLAQMLLYSLPAIGIAFQYFNLVERKEARGLMSQIQTIGEQGPSTSPPNDEQY